MKINVRAIPGAKQNSIKLDGDVCRVYTTARANDGRANEAVIKLLAAHFKVARSKIKILRGHTSRNKLVEILGCNGADDCL